MKRLKMSRTARNGMLSIQEMMMMMPMVQKQMLQVVLPE